MPHWLVQFPNCVWHLIIKNVVNLKNYIFRGNRSKCILTDSDLYAGSTNAACTNVAEPVPFAKAGAG